MQNEQLLLDRISMVGGSDMAALYNLLPWYCRKKLWFEKVGQEPDWEDNSKETIFKRGHAIEGIAAQEYSESTGHKLRQEHIAARIKDKPHCGVHIDRHIVAFDERGPGVLEVKNVAHPFQFSKFKSEGTYEAYALQLQWGMHVKGWKWGVFVIFCSTTWDWFSFEIDYDPEIGEELERKADEFWAEVQGGVEQQGLSDGDKRCNDCNFRPTCKGEYSNYESLASDTNSDFVDRPDIAQAVKDWDEIDKIAKEAASENEVAKAIVKDLIGDDQSAITQGFKVYFKESSTNRLDTKMLRALYPEEAKECTRKTATRSLRKFPIKEQ